MKTNQIPEDIAAAIDEAWPDGVVEHFDTDESYFQDIHAALERDLRKISGASLKWQTEPEPESTYWDLDDDYDDEPPLEENWQSYHVFFLAAEGQEFEFETEIESYDETADLEEDADVPMTTYKGRGCYGYLVAVSLAMPFAIIDPSEYAEFEECSNLERDLGSLDDPAEPPKSLGEKNLSKLERLRAKIAAVLAKHRVQILDRSIQRLPVSHLKSGPEVFLGAPLRVRDVFFFQGV
jgi:hypothetical protein